MEARHGIPVGVATDAANVPETVLGPTALVTMPVKPGRSLVAVLADKAYDCDWLRRHLKKRGFVLLAPHRSNRVKPATNDGRRMRRYARRWIVERTFAWLHSFRRVVTRFERMVQHFDGFVHLACAFLALEKLI